MQNISPELYNDTGHTPPAIIALSNFNALIYSIFIFCSK